MKALLFPGQGAQFTGMGHKLYTDHDRAREIFDQADEILGYALSKIMFEGTEEELKQTKITQPALYVHSMATLAVQDDIPVAKYMAGHSLGECSALAAAGALTFEDGLKLVDHRARAMQAACDIQPSTMAAIVGLEDKIIENVCLEIDEVVVPANYNCPGQLVISGSITGIEKAVETLKEQGARQAVILKVAGAFHSPLMSSASDSFADFVDSIQFKRPICPVVQNVSASAVTDPDELKSNLIKQLTSPVRWSSSVQYMISNGISEVVEVGGNGKVLRGLMRRIDRSIDAVAM